MRDFQPVNGMRSSAGCPANRNVVPLSVLQAVCSRSISSSDVGVNEYATPNTARAGNRILALHETA